MRRSTAVAAFVVLMLTCVVGAPGALAHGGSRSQHPKPSQGCGFANGIKHVIYLQFDNTHLFRDRPQFASDLEQMPHLLGFMRQQGTLNDNDHTILISHTAGGILSAFTGLYPDRNGQTVTNAYRYFKDDGTSASVSSFKYWTDLVDSEGAPPADGLPNMVNADSGQPKTTPAPWVPYTRAGCDFGAVASANVVLENTSTGPNGDMTKVFGQGSPEWNKALASNAAPAGTAARALAQTDFVGFAVHCGRGGGLCAGNADAKPDALPDEPGGYAGFQGLFGAKAVNPAITGGQPVVKDTEGQPIADPFGQPGFPGFDGMLAKVSLGYVAQMQEAGVPVTYAYISDAHDNHALARASGPGEADYQAQLQAYDQAFGAFFDRLKAHGIDKRNTLFVFTVDENDHFAGGDSADGTWSHTFCDISAGQTCPPNQIGEVNANLAALLPGGEPSLPGALRLGADGLRQRQPAADRRGAAQARTRRGGDQGGRPVHQRRSDADHEVPRRPRRRADAAHGQRRPAPDADVHAVRQPRLLPVDLQLPGRGRRWAGLHRLPLRLESRRRHGRHRPDLARTGRAGRAQPRPDEPYLGRSHRRAPDDARAARPEGQLRAGRARDGAGAARRRGALRPAPPPGGRSRSWAASTSRSRRRSARSPTTRSSPRRARSPAAARPTTARTRRPRPGSPR